jgi:hypothetical protein
MTIFLILLMILAIIINVIISNSINENFETKKQTPFRFATTNKLSATCYLSYKRGMYPTCLL